MGATSSVDDALGESNGLGAKDPLSCCRSVNGLAHDTNRTSKQTPIANAVVGSKLLYKMYVVPVVEVLKLERLKPHQELLEAGTLVEYEVGMGPVLFVSHQWCGSRHPDPGFEQFPVLQAALQNLLAGTTGIESDWVTGVVFNVATLPPEEMQEFGSAYVWYDFFSVPQIAARNAHQNIAQDLQAAVDSIPAYVERSKFFFILAPPVAHADLPGQALNYGTWKERGWCRVERAARQLSAGATHMVLVRGSKLLSFVSALDYLHDPPGQGCFSVESDRAVVGAVMKTLLSNKLKACLAAGQLHHFRMLMGLRAHILSGLRRSEEALPMPTGGAQLSRGNEALVSSSDPALLFLRDYRFQTATECDAKGWRPIHYAAITGDVNIMQSLMRQKADIAVTTARDDTDHQIKAGATTIMLCARFCTRREGVEYLLEAKMDPNVSSSTFGHRPLHYWCFSGSKATLECLLEHRADIHGASYLTNIVAMAAIHGRVGALRSLLDARGNVAHGTLGNTPLISASVTCTDPTVVQLLVDRGCPIHSRLDLPWNTVGGAFLRSLGLTYHLGRRSHFAELCHHAAGATALISAACCGNHDFVKALLDAKADPTLRNEAGFTAEEAATSFGYREVADLIRRKAPFGPRSGLRVLSATAGDKQPEEIGEKP